MIRFERFVTKKRKMIRNGLTIIIKKNNKITRYFSPKLYPLLGKHSNQSQHFKRAVMIIFEIMNLQWNV